MSFSKRLEKVISLSMIDKIKTIAGRWANTNEAAKYYNLKPSTLKKNRSVLGHDDKLVWVKANGKVLYDLWETDKRLEGQYGNR